MRSFASLCLLYARSVFGFEMSFRKDRIKKTIGNIALAFLVSIALANFAFVGGLVTWEAYGTLEGAGLQRLSLLNGLSLATVMVVMLGFLTVVSTYFMSDAESALVALPLTSRQLLGAKMVTVYLTDFLAAFLTLSGAVVAYGIRSGADAGFYAAGFALALATPLLPIAASYAIAVPLIRAFRFLRNKNALMIAGGFVGIGFAVFYNVWNQTSLSRLEDAQALMALIANPDSLPRALEGGYPPIRLALESLLATDAAGRLLPLLALFGLGIGACVLATLALGPWYAHGLTNFNESRAKKLKDAEEFVGRAFRRKPLFGTLFMREFVTMNREPSWLLNGPMIIVLLPVIMGVTLATQADQMARLLALVGAIGPWGAAGIAALAGASLGTMASVAATAVSREGKSFYFLKCLPVEPALFLKAKLAHGALFAIVGLLLGSVGLGAFLGVPFLPLVAATLAALAFCLLHEALSLYVDAALPKLKWDNPIAAVKQNPNAVIGIFLTFGAVGGSVALVAAAGLSPELAIAVAGGGSLAVFLGLYLALPAFARKRFSEIE